MESEIQAQAKKIEELEKSRDWQQKQLEMMQHMLDSSKNIQVRNYIINSTTDDSSIFKCNF